jgi:holo-[acyl-carrier protein] synthase
MQCIGIDIIEIARIEKAIARWGERFLKRVYTEKEIELCQNRAASLAARFAAKEAAMKALGIDTRGVGWQEVETIPSSSGQPMVYLHGKAQNRAQEIGLKGLAISLSHSREYVIASVIGETLEDCYHRPDAGD